MTKPYLPIQIGNNESVRGRALISIEVSRSPQKFIHSLVDVDGSKLKEDLVEELLNGKLISLDIFMPSYVRTRSLEKDLSLAEARQLAERESRDLVTVYFDEMQSSFPEIVNEQMNSRYIHRLLRKCLYTCP